MNGRTHRLVAMLSLACLDDDERRILLPRWGGIESGATLSDDFRIMWEPDAPESQTKSLVHRCYVDSADPKDHGGVIRALDHSSGSIAFIQDYLAGELEGAFNEIEFLENLGMFLGVASHHIADLCTPPHVKRNIDFRRAGYKSHRDFHGKLERDIARFMRSANLLLSPAKKIMIGKEYFWDIAQRTFDESCPPLEDLYHNSDADGILKMVSDVLSRAVTLTRNVWHTVLVSTNMADRAWSSQPLL